MSELPQNLRSNPLLNPPSLPHGAPALASVKTEHFMPAIEYALDDARAGVKAIKNNADAPTFKNTIEALEVSGSMLDRVYLVFANIALANADDDIRELEEKIDVMLAKHGNDISLDADLFKRIKHVYDNRAAETLTDEQKMLLEKTYKGFVRSGALLADADKEEFKTISERLAQLSSQFNSNEVNAIKSYQRVVTDESELDGLPERAKKMYKQMAVDAGQPDAWIIKLSPHPGDIMQYATNRALRQEISEALARLASEDGPHDNRPLVLETVQLRQRMAELMGFENYAALALDDRMAKTPEAVMNFLEENLAAYKPAAEKFLKDVKDFAAKKNGLTDIQGWDMAYYIRQMQEETFKIKLEDLRAYFEQNATLDGLRQHVEKLFNIDLVEANGKYETYHADVKTYEVFDRDTKEIIGVFYADYYARPGAKSSGAWAYSFRSRGVDDTGINHFPLVTNVCNYPKPANGEPSLLDLDEVRTLYHEFGHALHNLLANGTYSSLAGTSVKRDFVELPSQLQENWVREKELLDTFAKHYKTGEPMSDELIEKVNKMDSFGAGYYGLRQTYLALIDMTWHTKDPKTIASVEALEDEVVAKAWLFPRKTGTMSAHFGHLFSGGYAAGYYGYKWAEVLDADVFDAFKQKGLYDRETAKRLRETIYSKGGAVDPMELFVQMMGRAPDPAALFRREGIEVPEKKAANDAKPRNNGNSLKK